MGKRSGANGSRKKYVTHAEYQTSANDGTKTSGSGMKPPRESVTSTDLTLAGGLTVD